VSVPRNQAIWKALGQIPESAWSDALQMPGAQVRASDFLCKRLVVSVTVTSLV
jgi:hypothetical protein